MDGSYEDRFSARRFLLACGGAEPIRIRLRTVRNLAAYTDYDFDQPFILIGNRPDADLNILHPEVEPRHLLLHLFHGRVFVLNLASGPVRFPQQTARGEGWLARGEEVEFAEFTLEVVSDHAMKPGEARMPSPTASPPAPGRELICEVLDVKSANSICHVRRELVLLGNSRRTKITLLTPVVSSVHCAFVRTVMGYWIVDLCGRGGVTIDGRAVRCAQIVDGSLLQIGHLRFRLAYQTPARDGTEGMVELGATIPGINPNEQSMVNLAHLPHLAADPVEQSMTNLARPPYPEPEPPKPNPVGVLAAPPAANGAALVEFPRPPAGNLAVPSMPSLDLSAVFATLQENITRQFQQTFDQMLAMFRTMLDAQFAQVREEFERVLKKVLNAQLGGGERFTPEEIPFAEIVTEVVNKLPAPDHSGNRPVPPPDLHLWFLNQLKGMTGR